MGKTKTIPFLFVALFTVVIFDAFYTVPPTVDETPLFLAPVPVHGPVKVRGKATIGLAEIMQLEPVEVADRFGNISAGFDVVNVKAIIPSAVRSTPSGYMVTTDRPIVAALVNAVKNQQGQIDDIVFKVDSIIQ